MEEFKFVFKCFLISCVIVVFSQTQISGETLENKAFVFLQHSDTAQWVRDAADGGIKMIRQGSEVARNFITDKLGQSQNSASSSGYSAKRAAVQRQQPQQRGIAAEADLNNSEELTNEDRY